MSSLEDFKQRLRETDNYHLEERAKRLEEIGGPGVGGLGMGKRYPFILGRRLRLIRYIHLKLLPGKHWKKHGKFLNFYIPSPSKAVEGEKA